MPKRNIPANRLPGVCECGAHGHVQLTRGFVAFFSPGKLPLVEGRAWLALVVHSAGSVHQYAASAPSKGKLDLMHRVITGVEKPFIVDHRDGNGLRNEDDNLRICTRARNNQNARAHKDKAIPFKGVSRDRGAFQANIHSDKKHSHLGSFSCPIEAARAYDRAALTLHGEYALTNVMLGLLPPEDAPSAPRDLFSA